jgi:uncharacterized protein (DUF983 family)
MEFPNYGIIQRLRASLFMRCPRCCKGSVYQALLQMRESCPACGLKYEREAGYFTGAMYASYFLGIFSTAPVWFGMLMAGASYTAIVVVGIGMVVVLMPLYFHYSRVLWMHIDAYFNPKTFIADVPA